MMDNLKQRIVDHIWANEPVKRADLVRMAGIAGKAVDREVLALKELGLIIGVAGYGYFKSQETYEAWRVTIGTDLMRARALKGALTCQMSRRENNSTYPARIVDLLADGQPRGAVEIAQGLGVTYKQISTAISTLVKTGELKHRGAKGGRVYSLAKQVKRPTLRCKSENVIFQECRQSEAMKRVLMVWGRAPA